MLAHPLHERRKSFIMLQAYIDESRSHQGSEICAIAGYFGGVNQWRKFERSWKAILDREAIGEFHAKRFWGAGRNKSRVGEYKDWSDERAIGFFSDLLKVIGEHKVYPFGAALVMKEWNQLSHDEKRWLTGASRRKGKFIDSGAPSKGYFVPFHHCILRPAWYCKPGIKMHFVADANKNIEGWAVQLFQQLKTIELRGGGLGDFIFADSKDACPLQAADLLVYEMYHYAKRRVQQPNARPRRLFLAALRNMKDSRQDLKLFDKRGLDLYLASLVTSSCLCK